jgi:peptide/nickel transport system permease protein
MSFLPTWGAWGFSRGWLLDTLWHLVLPVACFSYGGFAFLSKLTRSSILENLSADYVRTARAKGVAERDVLLRHVFRNSLLALITVAASIIPGLLAGSIVIETIFSIPGMGRLGVQAVQFRDRELVLAVTLIGGVIGLLSQLARDLCYAVADPRVSYE